MDSTDSARFVKPSSLIQLAQQVQGAIIPTATGFVVGLTVMAALLGRETKSVREKIRDRKMPHWRDGHEILIDPEVYLAHCEYINPPQKE